MAFSKRSVFTNFVWRFAERIGAQAVQFIVTMILARLLMPEDYGTIALIMVFINILSIFIDSGLGTALIQKKDADSTDFSTVFYFSVVMGISIYLIMFFSAPFIADFYKTPVLVPLIRVLSIDVLLNSMKNIQHTWCAKNLQFKKFFYSTIIGTVLSAGVGIYMAYQGFGVWALICQTLTNSVCDLLILWITVEWKPTLQFSFIRLKSLFSYSWKLLAASILDKIYSNLTGLIIGRMYTKTDLAFYNKGRTLPELIVNNINSSLDNVLFPVMAEIQDEIDRIKEITRKAIKTSVYLIAPCLMGLSACAENVITILFSEKWLPAVPFMRVFCITFMFYPIHTANLSAIRALGRSDLFLKLEIWKKITGLIVILSTMWFGVMAMAYGCIAGSFISQIINSWPSKKLFKYSYVEQLKDIIPSIGLSVFMGCIVYLFNFIDVSIYVKIILQIITGVIIYTAGSYIFKFESFFYLLSIFKKGKEIKEQERHNEQQSE